MSLAKRCAKKHAKASKRRYLVVSLHSADNSLSTKTRYNSLLYSLREGALR
jgi:hypothetical protein